MCTFGCTKPGQTLGAQSGTGRVTCGRLPRSKFHKKDFVQNQLSPGIHLQSCDWDCLATSNYPARNYPGKIYPDRNYPGRNPPSRKRAVLVLVLVLGQEVAGPQQRLLKLRPRAGPAGGLGGQTCNMAYGSRRDGTLIAGGS